MNGTVFETQPSTSTEDLIVEQLKEKENHQKVEAKNEAVKLI